MNGNPHYDKTLVNARELPEYAVSQATLALAYEQRTANLIAYYTLWNRIEGAVPTKTMDAELEQRLGLRDE